MIKDYIEFHQPGWQLIPVFEERVLIASVPTPRDALRVARRYTDSLATSLINLGFKAAFVRHGKCRPGEFAYEILPRMANKFQENPMTQLDTSFVWLGGKIVLTRNLYRELGLMLESDQPQGLVTPDADPVQLWLNPKSVELFGLSSLEEGVERKTASDWYAADLPRKQQAIRDAGESPFELPARVLFAGDRQWRLMRYRYKLVDNRYLIASSVADPQIITSPEAVSIG